MKIKNLDLKDPNKKIRLFSNFFFIWKLHWLPCLSVCWLRISMKNHTILVLSGFLLIKITGVRILFVSLTESSFLFSHLSPEGGGKFESPPFLLLKVSMWALNANSNIRLQFLLLYFVTVAWSADFVGLDCLKKFALWNILLNSCLMISFCFEEFGAVVAWPCFWSVQLHPPSHWPDHHKQQRDEKDSYTPIGYGGTM